MEKYEASCPERAGPTSFSTSVFYTSFNYSNRLHSVEFCGWLADMRVMYVTV